MKDIDDTFAAIEQQKKMEAESKAMQAEMEQQQKRWRSSRRSRRSSSRSRRRKTAPRRRAREAAGGAEAARRDGNGKVQEVAAL